MISPHIYHWLEESSPKSRDCVLFTWYPQHADQSLSLLSESITCNSDLQSLRTQRRPLTSFNG